MTSFSIVRFLIPTLKYTKLSHIQAILSGKKRVVKQANVPARSDPNWPEITVKNVYQQALQLPNPQDYLPDPTGSENTRDFFQR